MICFWLFSGLQRNLAKNTDLLVSESLKKEKSDSEMKTNETVTHKIKQLGFSGLRGFSSHFIIHAGGKVCSSENPTVS